MATGSVAFVPLLVGPAQSDKTEFGDPAAPTGIKEILNVQERRDFGSLDGQCLAVVWPHPSQSWRVRRHVHLPIQPTALLPGAIPSRNRRPIRFRIPFSVIGLNRRRCRSTCGRRRRPRHIIRLGNAARGADGCAIVLRPSVVAAVLFAALLHAVWNVAVRAGHDRRRETALVVAGSAVLAGVVLPFLALPPPATWRFLFVSAG